MLKISKDSMVFIIVFINAILASFREVRR